MKDNHTPGEMNKPVHRNYVNCNFPLSHNEGMDEMEAYYEPLLGECLGALDKIQKEIDKWTPQIDGYETAPPIGMQRIGVIAKAILAKRKGEL